MKKSKRQRQLDLLDKLIERIGESDDVLATNDALWTQQKVAELMHTEGDIKGLSKKDMRRANGIWTRHAPQNHPVTGQ